VSADPDEPDTALLDQPSREAFGGAEHVGRLGDGQQAVSPRGLVAPGQAGLGSIELMDAGWEGSGQGEGDSLGPLSAR
jgi:hypothetical protein